MQNECVSKWWYWRTSPTLETWTLNWFTPKWKDTRGTSPTCARGRQSKVESLRQARRRAGGGGHHAAAALGSQTQFPDFDRFQATSCQKMNLTRTACLPWRLSFSVYRVLQVTSFHFHPCLQQQVPRGRHFSKNLSNLWTAFHHWTPSASCVICVKITNSLSIGLWRKKLPQNHSLVFFNIQTSGERRGNTHLWAELLAFCAASLEKNMATCIPDSAFVFTFQYDGPHSSPCKCLPSININGSHSCASRGKSTPLSF